jgi:hypothetical protein
MQFIELIPEHKIGDIVVFRDRKEGKDILVQAKINGATAKIENDTYVWSYEVEFNDLVHYLEDVHVVLNVTKNDLT